jgi:hypothetical protein
VVAKIKIMKEKKYKDVIGFLFEGNVFVMLRYACEVLKG